MSREPTASIRRSPDRARPPGASTRVIAAATVALAVLVACRSAEEVRKRSVALAIARAEAFLQQRGTKLDPLMTYVLARLERRYGLTWTAAQRAGTLATAPPAAQLRLFGRLVDPGTRPDPADLATIANQSDRLLLAALYCDELGEATLDALAPWAEKGGADVSHGALALGWLLENGCVATGAAEPLRQRFLRGLAAEAARVPATDVGIETMAMLDYLGAAGRVESAWVDAVMAAQHADGGWGERPDDASNDHTTTLALWVLLGASGRPGAAVAWIPSRK